MEGGCGIYPLALRKIRPAGEQISGALRVMSCKQSAREDTNQEHVCATFTVQSGQSPSGSACARIHTHTDRHTESLLQFQPAQANNSQKDTSCSQIKNSSWEVDGLGGTSQSTPKIGRVWERSGQCCEEATKSCLRLHSPSPGIILIVLSCTVHSLPLLNSSTHYTI